MFDDLLIKSLKSVFCHSECTMLKAEFHCCGVAAVFFVPSFTWRDTVLVTGSDDFLSGS